MAVKIKQSPKPKPMPQKKTVQLKNGKFSKFIKESGKNWKKYS